MNSINKIGIPNKIISSTKLEYQINYFLNKIGIPNKLFPQQNWNGAAADVVVEVLPVAVVELELQDVRKGKADNIKTKIILTQRVNILLFFILFFSLQLNIYYL